MKSYQIRFLTVLLSLVMMLAPLVSCGGNKPADTTAPSSVTTEPTTPTDTTESAENDSTTEPAPETTEPDLGVETPDAYTIEVSGYALNVEVSRPQKSESGSIDVAAAQKVALSLSDKLGTMPTLTSDWAKVEDSSKFEIIVGVTDHPEVDSVLGDISYGEYMVKAVGNKIIVIAYSEEGYSAAISHLLGVFNDGLNRGAKTITVDTDKLEKIGIADQQLANLPYYDGGRYLATYDAGRVTATADCDEVIIKSTTVSEYDAYLKTLEAEGYAKYTDNNIGENKFATYTNSKYTLNVGYYAYEKAARLLIEPRGDLPELESENTTTKKTTSQITMIGVATSEAQNGLSTLIRLEDGRFIVIDGANNDSTVRDTFINTIKSQAKDYTQKPIVAAWIITHSHGDHSGLLYGKYNDIKNAGISIEKIILNEISEKEAKRSYTYSLTAGKPGTYQFGETEGGQSKRIIETVAPTFGAELYKAHVGQTFFMSNLRMDVLYSLEAYAPTVCNSFNTTSIVIKMTFTDSATGKVTTFLSTGDATGFGMEVAKDIFGEYMQCDILSINHHGYTTWGGDAQMKSAFKTVAPVLLLWPVGDKDYNSLQTRDYNAILYTLSSYKESYNSGDRGRSVIVPLPYVVGNVQNIK